MGCLRCSEDIVAALWREWLASKHSARAHALFSLGVWCACTTVQTRKRSAPPYTLPWSSWGCGFCVAAGAGQQQRALIGHGQQRCGAVLQHGQKSYTQSYMQQQYCRTSQVGGQKQGGPMAVCTYTQPHAAAATLSHVHVVQRAGCRSCTSGHGDGSREQQPDTAPAASTKLAVDTLSPGHR